ncbi:MAG TPA: zinc ribbon domain-containing protein [Chthonomonadales bacterium]|nr:zinc ribbon domain-containing protein [Chthonomonadales bacterium]
MSEAWFSNNVNDLSVKDGAGAGFRFEFPCGRCRDPFRTEFEPYRGAQAADLLGRASGMLGGVFGARGGGVGKTAGSAVEKLAQVAWKKAHEAALARAVESARRSLHRCTRCSNYFCVRCINAAQELCRSCAPDAGAETEVAQSGQKVEVKRDQQVVCPGCGAESRGVKFCSECGHKLPVRGECPSCRSEIELSVRFCPECGAKLGQ